MVMDANGNSVPAESVLHLREATLKNLHHHTDDLRASESSDDEGDGGQVKPRKWKTNDLLLIVFELAAFSRFLARFKKIIGSECCLVRIKENSINSTVCVRV